MTLSGWNLLTRKCRSLAAGRDLNYLKKVSRKSSKSNAFDIYAVS